jgi:hypothetical protein
MPLVTRIGKSSQAVFPAAFDLLCFSASVGYARGLTGPISKGSSDKTDGGEVVMSSPDRKDRVLCDMVAVAHTGSDEILETGRLQDRLDIFMKFACGGLDYILKLAETRSARAAVEAIIRGTDRDNSVEALSELVDLGDHS